jgi:hypothetical protein
MLSDSLTVTVAASPHTLARVPASGQESGSFQEADGALRFTVSHSNGKRRRTAIRITTEKTIPDPIIATTNNVVNMSAYLVVDVPKQGYTVAQKKEIVDALTAWLNASSGANLTKVLGGEA